MIHFQFRLQHRCDLSLLSADFPNVAFTEWCDSRIHYVEIGTEDPRTVRAIRRRFRQILGPRSRLLRSSRSVDGPPSLVMRCLGIHSATTQLFERNSVMLLYPLVYRYGWKHVRSLVLDSGRLPKVIEALSERGRLEVIQKRPVRNGELPRSLMIPADVVLGELTRRQRLALLRSIEGGYFDIPRRVRLNEVVLGTGVPRTTFGEHLHKAEGKLMRAMAPYLSYSTGTGGEPVGSDPSPSIAESVPS